MVMKTVKGILIAIVLSFAMFLPTASPGESIDQNFEGTPISIGVISSDTGGIGSSTWTRMNVLMRNKNGSLEFLPISIVTKDRDNALKVIALINGAIKMEKPLKVYVVNSPDTNTIFTVESVGITIKILE